MQASRTPHSHRTVKCDLDAHPDIKQSELAFVPAPGILGQRTVSSQRSGRCLPEEKKPPARNLEAVEDEHLHKPHTANVTDEVMLFCALERACFWCVRLLSD